MDKRLKDLSDYRLEQTKREEVEEQIENAEKFYYNIEKYLRRMI